MAPYPTPRWIVYLALSAVALFWGLNAVVMKAAFQHWDPLAFTGLRFLAMVALAVGIARASGEPLRIERGDLPWLLLGAACGYGVYQYFYVIGLAHTTAFASALLGALAPVFTLMLAVTLGQERSRSGRWIGAAIALFGVAVFEGVFNGHAAMRIGDLLTLVGTAIFAGYNILAARLVRRYSPTSLIAITLVFGALMIAPGGLWGLAHQDFSRLRTADWLLFAYSVVFPMVIGYQLWSWGIAKIGAGATSLFNFAVPVIAGFAAVAFLRTPITSYEIVGAGICIGGLVAAQSLVRFSFTKLLTQRTVPVER